MEDGWPLLRGVLPNSVEELRKVSMLRWLDEVDSGGVEEAAVEDGWPLL